MGVMEEMELFWGALLEGIIFLTYAVICISMAKRRFSRKFTMRFYGIMAGSILLLQAALIFSGQDITLVTTLLPVTAYLPFTIGVYVLTGFQLSQTASIGMLGLIIVHVLKIVNKVVIKSYIDNLQLRFKTIYIFMIPLIMLLAGVLVLLILRFLRKPFQRYMESSHTKDWLLLFLPTLMSFLLLSYFSNSMRDARVLMILLFIAICVCAMVIRIVFFQSVVLDMKEAEQKMEVRLQAQRQEYEEIARKMEAGRIYRHDMRHHLLVINELAMQEDVSGILNYVENMNGKLAETEREFYCANAMINTMLSVCIGQAKAAGCAVSAEVQLPEIICYDEMDVCMILANALENAVNACKKIAEEKERYIHVKAGLFDNGKLFISICNSCNNIPQFGEDGLPVSDARKKSKEHGIGLKSIRVLVEKYQGVMQCRYSEGEFRLQAVLFKEQHKEASAAMTEERSAWKKLYISGACIAGSLLLFLVVYLISASSAVSETMWKEIAQGSGVRLQKHEWNLSWGGSYLNVSEPILEAEDTISSSPLTDLSDNGGDVEEWNSQVQEYVDEMKKRFLNYYVRRNYGYVGCDVNWEVLRDDEAFLSVRMTATINAGGSGEYSRCFTWDIENGKTLALKDLFLEESDYISVISEEILRQMTERVQNGQGNYFIPGGIWREDECFKQISGDQNFYLNEEYDLVIIFDEYEVAPGSMGMPQFVVEQEVLEDILCQRFLVNDEVL